MNIFKIILQIGLITAMYVIGTVIQQYFSLFIPGSVIGLILMFLLLISGILKLEWVELGAAFMMRHLVVFFIPATVGVISYYSLFKGKGSLLILTTIISTVLVMGVTGWTSQKLYIKQGGEK